MPTQNVEKIRSRSSSVAVSPVIAESATSASRARDRDELGGERRPAAARKGRGFPEDARGRLERLLVAREDEELPFRLDEAEARGDRGAQRAEAFAGDTGDE